MCPEWIISDDKLPYLWCALHFRRIETLHDGMRWFDIKRFGIEIKHEISYPVVTKTLTWNDDRRAIQLPQEALIGGQQPNPRENVGDLNNVSIEGSSTTPNGLQLYLQLQSEMSTLTKAPENE